jgi:hypothetical protein
MRQPWYTEYQISRGKKQNNDNSNEVGDTKTPNPQRSEIG